MPLQYPAIDSLISQFEGFGKAGVPATVNNNPGNVIAGSFANANGAVGSNNGFAVFPDPATGTSAMDALVSHYDNAGLTIDQLIAKWAPGTAIGNTPAGTQSYQNFLQSGLGVPGSTPISTAEKKTPDSGTTPGATSGSSTPATSASPWNPLTNIANAYNMLTGGNSTNNPNGQPLSWSRVGAFVLGMVFIAGGLYLFKPVMNVVNSTAASTTRAAAA